MGWEIGLTAVSAGLGAMQQLSAARDRKRQEAIKQRQLTADKQRARIQMIQEEMQSTREASRVQGSNLALVAAKGFDPGQSGTFLAIKEQTERDLAFDVGNIKLFGASKVANAQNSILASKAASQAAGRAGTFGALNTLFSGATKIHSML